MKQINFLFLAFFMLLAFSCSKDDSIKDPVPELTIADLAGSWKATSSIFTNNSNTSESVDFIAKGRTVRFTMLSDGRLRTWVDFNDSPVDEWDSNAVLQGDNTLVVTPSESDRPVNTITFKIEEDLLTFTNENALFDFTLTGAEEVSATSITIFIPNE